MAAVSQKSIESARTRFFNGLPKKLHCPHCDQTRKKENFGVRLVNKEAALRGQAKPQFFRQSHCNTCRG